MYSYMYQMFIWTQITDKMNFTKVFESTLKTGEVSSEILLQVQSINIKKTLSCI